MARSGSGEGGKERGRDREVDWMRVEERVLVLVRWCAARGGGGGGEVVAGGHDLQDLVHRGVHRGVHSTSGSCFDDRFAL